MGAAATYTSCSMLSELDGEIGFGGGVIFFFFFF